MATVAQTTLRLHGDRAELLRRFEEYDTNNPHVWRAFERLALWAYNNGIRKIGGWYIIGYIRWRIVTRTKSKDGFKINNDYVACYTRKWARAYPDKKDLFTYRETTRF